MNSTWIAPLLEHDHTNLQVFYNVFLQQLGVPVPSVPTRVLAGQPVLASHPSHWIWFQAGREFGYRVLSSLCKMSINPVADRWCPAVDERAWHSSGPDCCRTGLRRDRPENTGRRPGSSDSRKCSTSKWTHCSKTLSAAPAAHHRPAQPLSGVRGRSHSPCAPRRIRCDCALVVGCEKRLSHRDHLRLPTRCRFRAGGAQLGYRNAYPLCGGFDAWKAAQGSRTCPPSCYIFRSNLQVNHEG